MPSKPCNNSIDRVDATSNWSLYLPWWLSKN
eukprot:Gb_27563 [translate_table: standard]